MSISGMVPSKREWSTRVETVVEGGRRENLHCASCLPEVQLLSEKNKMCRVESR